MSNENIIFDQIIADNFGFFANEFDQEKLIDVILMYT